MAYDLKKENEMKKYFNKLHNEYEFRCNGFFGVGSPGECHLLGDYYGSIDDFKKAASIYKMTCDEYNYGKSCTKYGDYLAMGKGCRQNPQTAYDYLSKGCKLDDEKGCLHAGILGTSQYYLEMGNKNMQIKAGIQLKKACDMFNSRKACSSLTKIYKTSLSGIIRNNRNEVHKLSAQRHDFGNPHICEYLSQMHRRGL